MMETLVLLGIAVILLSIFIPYIQSIRENSRRQTCQNNLYQLRDALQNYARDNDGFFPRVRYDVENNPRAYTAFTGADAGNPGFADSVVQANDVTASLWLLVRHGYITNLRLFVCPSSDGEPDSLTDARGQPVLANQRGNFRNRKNLTYSYASPFSNGPGYPLKTDRVAWDFAILADQNPGEPAATQPPNAAPTALSQANSPNHNRAGQNVLYGYNTVDFQRTPFAGVGWEKSPPGDNIYTARAATITTQPTSLPAGVTGVVGTHVGPISGEDSYLVPALTDTFPTILAQATPATRPTTAPRPATAPTTRTTAPIPSPTTTAASAPSTQPATQP